MPRVCEARSYDTCTDNEPQQPDCHDTGSSLLVQSTHSSLLILDLS